MWSLIKQLLLAPLALVSKRFAQRYSSTEAFLDPDESLSNRSMTQFLTDLLDVWNSTPADLIPATMNQGRLDWRAPALPPGLSPQGNAAFKSLEKHRRALQVQTWCELVDEEAIQVISRAISTFQRKTVPLFTPSEGSVYPIPLGVFALETAVAANLTVDRIRQLLDMPAIYTAWHGLFLEDWLKEGLASAPETTGDLIFLHLTVERLSALSVQIRMTAESDLLGPLEKGVLQQAVNKMDPLIHEWRTISLMTRVAAPLPGDAEETIPLSSVLPLLTTNGADLQHWVVRQMVKRCPILPGSIDGESAAPGLVTHILKKLMESTKEIRAHLGEPGVGEARKMVLRFYRHFAGAAPRLDDVRKAFSDKASSTQTIDALFSPYLALKRQINTLGNAPLNLAEELLRDEWAANDARRLEAPIQWQGEWIDDGMTLVGTLREIIVGGPKTTFETIVRSE